MAQSGQIVACVPVCPLLEVKRTYTVVRLKPLRSLMTLINAQMSGLGAKIVYSTTTKIARGSRHKIEWLDLAHKLPPKTPQGWVLKC
jgi:hypothetical protein